MTVSTIQAFTRRRLLAMAWLTGAATLLTDPAAAQDALAQIRQAGVIKIGNSAAFPPFEFVRNGDLVGYDIDLGSEIARRMGVKAQWQRIDFAGIIAALTSKRVDILLTAMVKTPERAERIAFSDPYFNSGIAAAVRPGVTVKVPEDLAGKIVAVQVGTAGERYVRDNFGSKVKEIKTYDEFLLAVADVEAGRADVVVNTMPPVRYNVRRRGDKLQIVGPWDTRDVGINTRKEDTALLAEINHQLADLKREGFLDKLDAKWFTK
jgi:ABC-type amino acid transport substrate-binding protein